MIVEDLMTRDPACCQRETPLAEVARMMVEHDCGCIPVLGEDGRPIGVITDRDIVCRVIAFGRDPANQIRRAVVVDQVGRCCGIVAQADLARRSEVLAGEVVAAVSTPTPHSSSVH